MNWMRRQMHQTTHINQHASQEVSGYASLKLLSCALILLGIFMSPVSEAQTANQGEQTTDPGCSAATGSEQLLTDSALIRTTKFDGLLDVYWSYYEHQPLSGISTMRTFDDQTNQFALNLLELEIKRTPDAANPFGYNFQLGFGNAMTFLNSQTSGGPGFAEFLKEGYVSYTAPAGTGLQVDVGKLTPAISSEVMESQADWNYSRGLLYDYGVPCYLFGVRSHYSFGRGVQVTAYLVNGWNNIVDTYSSGKTAGASVEWTATRRLSITENYLSGRGATPEDIGTRRLSSTVVEYRVTPRLSVMGNGVYGLSRDFAPTGRPAHWLGLAAYGRYRFSRDSFIAARYENYNDRDGATTCGLCQGILTPQRLQEGTLTVEKEFSGHLKARLEFRHDFSSAPVFFRAGTPIHTQNTVTAGLMFAFGDRGKTATY
jgi:Putative beta-barrel porin-2, OmpL-like. bbp2